MLQEHWAPSDRLELWNQHSKFENRRSIFINKPQIWVLNNYILTWKTLKTTFHNTITVILWKLRGFLVNQSMFCGEFSSTLLVPFVVLGYQKIVVRYGLLFWYHSQLLTMETHIIAYRTVPNRTARWKRAIWHTFKNTVFDVTEYKSSLEPFTSCRHNK